MQALPSRRTALAAALLAALLAPAAVAQQFAGNDFIPPNPVRVCVTPYAPFTMNGSFASGTDTIPGPIPYDVLKDLTPINTTIEGDDTLMAGFDMDYSRLVFNRMLGLNLTYIAAGTFVEMYMALRAGECDVGITAVEMDPGRTICLNTCPAPPFAPPEGDYETEGFDEATQANLCCMEFGAPYLSSGFAVLSKVSTAPFDVSGALFNADVGNAATVIIIMLVAVGWVIAVIERRNPHLGSVSRGSYWGLMMFLNAADEGPNSRMGRILKIIWLMSNVISLSIITSIISAKLTTAGLAVKRIQKLGDITGTLCIESAYPVAMQFVLRDPNRPVKYREEEISVCVDLLRNGTVQAVFTDLPVLSWMVSNYQLPSAYVSPILGPNPFSFVYAAGSLLRPYVNPSVIAAQTDTQWIPLASAILSRYFSTGGDSAGMAVKTPLHMGTLVAAVALSALTICIALLNGECGPGLKALPAVKKLLAAPPMPGADDDAEAGDAGGEPQLRTVLVELREIRSLLQSMNGGGTGSPMAFGRIKLPSWALGEPSMPPPVAPMGRNSGGSAPPAAAASTAALNAGSCVPPWGQPPAPPAPVRAGSRRQKRANA